MLKTLEVFAGRVVTASPTTPLSEIARLMDKHNVGAVVVVENRRPVGIVTDRDLALELGARGTALKAPVVSVMSTPPITVKVDENVLGLTKAMRDAQVRRLPVVDDDGELMGIVTADDLVRLLGNEMANVVQTIAPAMSVR